MIYPHALISAALLVAAVSANGANGDAAAAAHTPDDYPLGPDSKVQPGVPQGKLTKHSWKSRIYAGTTRDYWVYVPAQYSADKPACVMVFQDGWVFADLEGAWRVPTVFDNLIAKGDMPVTIGIFINPGSEKESYLKDPRDMFGKYHESQRANEYDVLTDTYARFLLEEMLPEVERDFSLTKDPDCRAICGSSSGGLCSWNAAWQRPDAFRKVLSFVGSFDDVRGGHACPFLIRKSEKKPIRAFLQAGSNDLDCIWGNWYLGNLQMESALKFKGYDYKFVAGDGGHTPNHGASIFPDALRWVWRDWEND